LSRRRLAFYFEDADHGARLVIHADGFVDGILLSEQLRASPATTMTHIAIAEMLDGKAVEWMEHVTGQQTAADRQLPED
jgi:hypothetical protein